MHQFELLPRPGDDPVAVCHGPVELFLLLRGQRAVLHERVGLAIEGQGPASIYAVLYFPE